MNERPPVGVAVVGHGSTASTLLAAARGIVPHGSLDGVISIDAGLGETPTFSVAMCDAIAKADRGRGVVVLVDLYGASPCACAQREGIGHRMVVVSGLSLAMLLKLTGVDRRALEPAEVAQLCADAGRRAVGIDTRVTNPAPPDVPPSRGPE